MSTSSATSLKIVTLAAIAFIMMSVPQLSEAAGRAGNSADTPLSSVAAPLKPWFAKYSAVSGHSQISFPLVIIYNPNGQAIKLFMAPLPAPIGNPKQAASAEKLQALLGKVPNGLETANVLAKEPTLSGMTAILKSVGATGLNVLASKHYLAVAFEQPGYCPCQGLNKMLRQANITNPDVLHAIIVNLTSSK